MAEIKLISECFVKPKYQVEAAKQPYHLTPIEIAMLSIDPVQKGLLYSKDRCQSATSMSHFLDKLKHSLSLALFHFYPLAGRFETQKYSEDEHASTIFIDSTKGPGARLIHATVLDLTVSDIISSIHVPTIVRSFFELGEKSVNHDGHTRALLSIQVTELQDGVFIGFTINHSVADGTSFIHFVSMLSEIFRSYEQLCDGNNVAKISRMPIFNFKPWVESNEDVAVLKLPFLEPEEFIDQGFEPGPLRERIFHFSRTSLVTLKDKVNRECGGEIVISSFLALTALVWKSITLARNVTSDQLTTCSVLMNARNRFEPPLSDDYFGNFIGGAQWNCTVDELLGYDLSWAAIKMREAVMAQDGKTIIGMYKFLAKSPIVARRVGEGSELHGSNSVVMGGSSRFDMYGPEFGFGRALATRMGYANKEDGKVTANPGSEGEGSVDLEICLKPQFMTALETNSEFMKFVSLNS